MAWIAPLVGGVMGYMGAKEQNKASSGAGNVDIRSTQTPYAPSEIYRQWLMDQAAQQAGMPGGYAIPGQVYRPGGGPGAPSTPGRVRDPETGERNVPPLPPVPTSASQAGGTPKMVQRPDGRWVPEVPRAPRGKGKAAKGGKDPAAPAQAPFQGMSPETDVIRDAMMKRAEQGHPLYDVSNDYTERTLSGDVSRDPNAYRTETADLLRDMPNDPNLQRYMDMLFEGQMPGSAAQPAATQPRAGTGGGGGGAFRISRPQRAELEQQQTGLAAAGGGVAAPGAGQVGVVDDMQAILAGKYLNEKNPYFDSLIAETEAQANAQLDARLKQNALRAAGSGMYGATPWQQIESESLSDFGTGLARATGGLRAQEYEARMGDLMNTLGIGAAYDTAGLDRAAQERIAAANRDASSAASGSAASAAMYNADQERASRAELARLEALGGAIGMGGDLRKFRAGGFGDLSDMMSQDQRFGLGMTPDLTGMDVRDWGAAGDLSLGSDVARNTFLGNRDQASVARSGISAQRGIDQQRLDFAREQWNDPLAALSRFGDVVNQASGGYGSTRDFGYDKRSQSPSHVNPWGQAAAGAAGGWAVGRDIQDYYGNR